MGLNIVLIDKSEIIKKMLSHSLHYFGASVHRFETLEDFPKEAAIDLVFIDWDIKIGSRPLALMAKAKIQQIPIVVLHQSNDDPQMKQFPRIKKPIDPNLVRELTAQLVPKVNQLKLHKFLKYPKTASFQEEPSDLQSGKQKEMAEGIDLPDLSPDEMDAIQSEAKVLPLENPSHSSPEGGRAEEGDLNLPELSADEKEIIQSVAVGDFPSSSSLKSEGEKTSSESISEIKEEEKNVIQSPSITDSHSSIKVDKQVAHQDQEIKEVMGYSDDLSDDISSDKKISEDLTEPLVDSTVNLKHTSSKGAHLASQKSKEDFQYHKESQVEDSKNVLGKESSSKISDNESSESKSSPTLSVSRASVLEKDNLDLDENTQNDLGPAALVNTDRGFSDQDISKFTVDKYKNSNVFKELIQNIVAESGHQILRESIVQHNKSFIEQMLKEYSQTLEFEKVLSDVLKEHGKERIQSLFATDSRNIVEQSVIAYLESSHFKSLLETTLKSVIQSNLTNHIKDKFDNLLKKEILLTVKQVIESEIKNLLKGAEDS